MFTRFPAVLHQLYGQFNGEIEILKYFVSILILNNYQRLTIHNIHCFFFFWLPSFFHCSIIKRYLNEFCLWAHEYIKNSNSNRQNGSLKAHIIFYSLCQAIFYIIAFRSRDLTVDKNSILFLQSLHLSALVNSNFNPLRACLPAVATAFAGVTRHFQLAYCHAILERNARRKLATVYANDTATPEEVLETFFPFDPYLLKA